MSWNHRVMRRTVPSIVKGHPPETFFAIYEVYYDGKGKKAKVEGFTADNIAPLGESLKILKEELQRMLEACDRTVLNWDDHVKNYTHKRPTKTKTEEVKEWRPQKKKRSQSAKSIRKNNGKKSKT